MKKYRGKYQKCRICSCVEEVHMAIVEVKDSCPKGKQFSAIKAVDKATCESCEYFKS